MRGCANSGPAGLLALLSIAPIAIALLAGVGFPSSSAGQSASPAPVPSCPPNPDTLSPKGGAGARFTMLIRINKPENVATYANPDGPIGGRIRARDIFVVNTRWRGVEPGEPREIVNLLRASFPCNRIIALNGLGSDPGAVRGYALSLADEPGVWGLMLDWEKTDWSAARATNPGMARWKRNFGRNLSRLASWMGAVASSVAATPGASPKRLGVIPRLARDWDYGKIARAIDAGQRQLGSRRGGFQTVMTQTVCRAAGAKGMAHRARRLFREYGRAKRKRRSLALQISFSGTPDRKAKIPVKSVSPGAAARCTRRALRRGAGAILYWASPESMGDLFSVKRIAKLRRR
jgi:hypothetical protein